MSSPTQDPVDQPAQRLKAEEVFDRERKSNRTRALALLTYHAGRGCRATARLVTKLAEPVSHSPISTWHQRASQLFRHRPAQRHEVLVADETTIHVEHEDGELEEYFLWAAINPRTEEVVYATVTQGRSGLEALGFVRGVLRYCTNVPYFLVDAADWYPWAFETVGADYDAVEGGVRNQVETWIGLAKNRMRAFRERFPHNAGWDRIRAWAQADAHLYNRDRHDRGEPRLT